jgi:hypothetical protein
MTERKRWPKAAEAARCDALAAAREIVTLGDQVKGAIRMGRRDLALAIMSEIQLAAKDIEMAMRAAKNGLE